MGLKALAKQIFNENSGLGSIGILLWNRGFGLNRFRVSAGNSIEGLRGALLKKSKINIYGLRNVIILRKGVILTKCNIRIIGNDNYIEIGDNVRAIEVDIHLEDNANSVRIGESSLLCGRAHFAATEGQAINIGEGCLFSSGITIRTGDSHSIFDVASGTRINVAKSVLIGERVWVGNQVIILKGAVIGADSVVASGSLVTKEFLETNLIIGGSPAKIIRNGVRWTHARSAGLTHDQ